MTAEQSIRNIEHLMDAVNAAARNTPKPDPRADLVDLFEAHAETHYDKSWIEVEEAVDLVMDREDEQVQAVVRHVEAIIRLCYPDDMTPNAKRMFERALGEYRVQK